MGVWEEPIIDQKMTNLSVHSLNMSYIAEI